MPGVRRADEADRRVSGRRAEEHGHMPRLVAGDGSDWRQPVLRVAGWSPSARPGLGPRQVSPTHSVAFGGRAVRAPNDLGGASAPSRQQAAPTERRATIEGLTAGERVRPTSGCADSEPKGWRCPERTERPPARQGWPWHRRAPVGRHSPGPAGAAALCGAIWGIGAGDSGRRGVVTRPGLVECPTNRSHGRARWRLRRA